MQLELESLNQNLLIPCLHQKFKLMSIISFVVRKTGMEAGLLAIMEMILVIILNLTSFLLPLLP